MEMISTTACEYGLAVDEDNGDSWIIQFNMVCIKVTGLGKHNDDGSGTNAAAADAKTCSVLMIT